MNVPIASGTPARRQRIGPAQLTFAAFAVLVHGLLLLLPLKRVQSPPEIPILEIEFHPADVRPLNRPDDDIKTSEKRNVTPSASRESEHRDALNDADQSPEIVRPGRPAAGPRRPISAATLLEHAKQMGVPARPDREPQLGRPGSAHAEGWRLDPILPSTSTVFDESFLPAETEVLDQWQDPDGTRHVVMRTPSGQTLCGQLESWDPFNPLAEPVAMYRLCAGGGRRGSR